MERKTTAAAVSANVSKIAMARDVPSTTDSVSEIFDCLCCVTHSENVSSFSLISVGRKEIRAGKLGCAGKQPFLVNSNVVEVSFSVSLRSLT